MAGRDNTEGQKITLELFGDGIGYVERLQYMGQDLTVVNAARASLNVESKTMSERDKKLLSFLAKSGHTSTAEHNTITFRIKVPLFIARQHMRHRAFSYNEISRRYTAEAIELYFPKKLRAQDEKNRQTSLETEDTFAVNGVCGLSRIKSCAQSAVELYTGLIDAGVAREQARMILPQNLYTTYWATGNLHNWINSFVCKRDHKDAQWEMRLLAQAVNKILTQTWPIAAPEILKKARKNYDE